jgi:hypothetical protein
MRLLVIGHWPVVRSSLLTELVNNVVASRAVDLLPQKVAAATNPGFSPGFVRV